MKTKRNNIDCDFFINSTIKFLMRLTMAAGGLTPVLLAFGVLEQNIYSTLMMLAGLICAVIVHRHRLSYRSVINGLKIDLLKIRYGESGYQIVREAQRESETR
jgi:hypothetical protein